LNNSRLHELFESAATFADLLSRQKRNNELWDAVYRHAHVSKESIERSATTGNWHLLVLSEDWCGDSVNILPVIARLAESAPSIDMRIVARDENPDLMDEHLTGVRRSRSIPVVILLDPDFVERDWWGPRPGPLQEWVIREGLALPKEERYRQVRMWYARDKGQTIVTELLEKIERLEGRNAKTAD
jgi:thioredoxin family protein